MNAFWTTLIEINLILSIIYLGYSLLLKNLTFFRWARFYLLGGMLTGLIYPFLKARKVIHTPAEGVNIALPDLTQSSGTATVSWEHQAVYLFSAIFLLLFLRFIFRFFSLGKIHADSQEAEFNGRGFRDTRRQVPPFSFWKWIYIHRKAHSEPEMKQIIAHEYIHTRERHTFDVIVAEICTIICWYNPLVKLLNRCVKDNLEFLVDGEVLNSGIDRVSYQHSLVGISLNSFPGNYPGNQFAFKTLKKRIRMMNKEQSPKFRLAAYLLLTPLVLAFAGLLTFSCQKETLDTLEKAKASEGIAWERSVTASYDEAAKKSQIESVKLKATGTDDSLTFEARGLEINDKTVSLKGPVMLRGTSNTGLRSPLILLDGKEVTDLNVISPDQIQAISVLKDKSAFEKYGEKGKNGVIEIYSKKSPR